MPGELSRSYKGPKDGRLPTWLGECLICWKGQPVTGWYRVDQGDEGKEFFCSEECLEEHQQ